MKKQVNCNPKGWFAVLLLLGIFGQFHLNAQTAFKAKLDKTTQVISLDENTPVGYLYQLNFADLNFASRESATTFFGPLNTDLVTFEIDFEKRTANIFLNTRDKTLWTVKDWNAYLASLTKK